MQNVKKHILRQMIKIFLIFVALKPEFKFN